MAESHLQVLLDGSTKMGKTQLLPKRRFEECLKAWFGSYPWKVDSCNQELGNKFIISVSCGEIKKQYIVYVATIRDEARQDDEFKSQLGNSYPSDDELRLKPLVLGVYVSNENCKPEECLIAFFKLNNVNFSTNPSLRGVRTKGLAYTRIYGLYQNEFCTIIRPDFLYYYINELHNNNNTPHITDFSYLTKPEHQIYSKYLMAIRTKPFLLLAGISGTGKSRIVRELAFKSCPKYLQDKEGTTPGNYCMIEVKPNWHDSTELLGYYSNLSHSYQFKKFVKFLVKAKMNPGIPFFVCLDEMNLAPVEQYFAEILSVIETRKKVTEGIGITTIKTGVIVESKHFSTISPDRKNGILCTVEKRISDGDWYANFFDNSQMSPEERNIVNQNRTEYTLCEEGLSLPENVIIIGTVNMDDTTHPFSRKVIDRAMTIEMNGGKLKNMFGGSKKLAYLEEEEQKKWQNAFKQEYVNADEVLAAHPDVAQKLTQILPERLETINAALKDTPFEVSYRVLNELTIMVGVMLDNNPEEELESIIAKAIDRILLMKMLPRIEGDSDIFNLKTVNGVKPPYDNRLDWLYSLAPSIETEEDENKDHQQTAKEKIIEMKDRLENQEFTRFWP